MKMKAKTLRALKASIRHWEENAADPEHATFGIDECALCGLFNREDTLDPCFGCPVSHHTCHPSCDGSPFEMAADAIESYQSGTAGYTRRSTATACNRMVKFLRSLLPDGDA